MRGLLQKVVKLTPFCQNGSSNQNLGKTEVMNFPNKINLLVLPSLLLLTLIAIQLGCSKDDLDKMASKVKDSAAELSEKSSEAFEKAKETANEATATIKEKASEIKDKTSEAMSNISDTASGLASDAGNLVSMNGSAEFNLDEPTKFPASYIRVVQLNETTKVLQIKSYKDGQSDSFPSFYLFGTVEGDVNSLNGKTVACKLFAQKSATSDIWQNATGETVAVKFYKLEDAMTASFSNAKLVNATDGSQTTSSGNFECVNYE